MNAFPEKKGGEERPTWEEAGTRGVISAKFARGGDSTKGRRTLVLGGGGLLLLLLASVGWGVMRNEGANAATLKNFFAGSKTEAKAAGTVAPGPAAAVVIAKVGGEPVYESEIVAEIQAGARGSRNDVIDAYVNTVIAAQAAQSEGSDEAKEAMEYARRKVLSQVYVNKLARTEAAAITEASVKEFYDKQIPASAFDKYAVSYYLTQDGADAEARFAEMQGGKSLDKLAALENKQTKTKYLAAAELPYGTGALVVRMKKGEITRPLATRDGFLLLRLDGTEAGTKGTLEQMTPQIRAILLQQRVTQALADRRKAAGIQMLQ